MSFELKKKKGSIGTLVTYIISFKIYILFCSYNLHIYFILGPTIKEIQSLAG